MADDLRAHLEAALRAIRFGLGTNARYGLSGNEVEAATEQLLPFVRAELDRPSAPSAPCKHGVLPEQGLCLYCASEQRATVPGVDACYGGRHCVTWGFCRRCAPELAEEASRLLKASGGTSEAYAAIVKGLTEPVADPQPVSAEFFTSLEKTTALESDDLHGWYAAMDDQPTTEEENPS